MLSTHAMTFIEDSQLSFTFLDNESPLIIYYIYRVSVISKNGWIKIPIIQIAHPRLGLVMSDSQQKYPEIIFLTPKEYKQCQIQGLPQRTRTQLTERVQRM